MKKPSLLRTLAEAIPAAEGHRGTEYRLRLAWPQLLGPAMAQRTCLLSAQRGRLVVGCWDPALLSGLRQSAQAVWPELQARIQRMTALRFHAIQVDPCDPPRPADQTPPAAPEDALAAVLRRYRQLAKDPFTSSKD